MTTDEIYLTGKSAKLPLKILIAVLVAVAAAAGWAAKLQMELSHAHELIHDIEDRVRALERR